MLCRALFNRLQLVMVFALCILADPLYLGLNRRASDGRIKPSKDPFYSPPAGFESATPGTILRHRSIPSASVVYGDPAFGAAFQLLYRTTSSVGNPQAVVTTVFVPANNANPNKFLSYQIPYDSAFINCDPSYTLRKSSRNAFLRNEDLLLIRSALVQGWFVATPDYEGPRAAYTSGPQAGQATLDGVRAVLASHSITGISVNKEAIDCALWGYSGGALASEWALEYQPTYAPELTFVGAALGGLTPNISSVFHTINKGIFAGLAAGGIIGLSRGYANLSSYVHKHLIPSKSAAFLKAGSQCYLKDVTEFFGADITSYFDNGGRILTDPIPASVIDVAGIMGERAVPKPPLYVYKAVQDEISPIADTSALVKKYCAKGVDIIYVKNVAGEHVTEGALGAPGALRFLVDRMNGVTLYGGCQTSTVNSTDKLNKSDEAILTKTVYEALQAILKKQFGLGL